jgi:SecD/SecF fusion protein
VTERRKHLVLVAVILAALAGVAALAVPGSPWQKKPVLGLDLQGGLEVVLKAVPPKGHKLTAEDLSRSVAIMRNRVDALGVGEQEIRTQDPDQIVIQLPGVKDPERVAEVIGSTAQMEMYDLETSLAGPSISQNFPVPSESLYDLLSSASTTALTGDTAKNGRPGQWYLFKNKKLVAGPLPSKEAILKTKAAKAAGITSAAKLPKAYKLLAVPGKTKVVVCDATAPVCPGVGTVPAQTYYYLFKFQPEDKATPIPQMTGKDLKLSGTRQDFDTSPGGGGLPIVSLQFTKEGSKRFAAITKAEAQRGKLLTNLQGQGQQITQHFAIVLDNKIRSFPQIDWQEYPNGISGSNGAQISGLDSLTEAKDLALVLQTGALPVNFQQLSATTVSATLGKDSLREALIAALVGFSIVAVFLLIFYRFLGLVAVLGLGIYAAFLYAAILIFNVTLTLPGFAGMILTIGVAADANVVIFERIKEEARAGKSVRAAIAAGYGKGFHTIIDANVVTVITALVLFAVATAGVKGFALLLLIGTALSLVTAVAATRAMLGLLAGFKWFSSPRFMGAAGETSPRWIQQDFMGKRRIWFAISGVIAAVALGALVFQGLNLGIDFKGGTQVTFSTPAAHAVGDIRSEAAKFGHADAVIQGRGTAQGGDHYRDFQIRTESLDPREQGALSAGLRRDLQVQKLEVRNVSSSFGRQIAFSAITAILVSLLLIVVYIMVRFPGWRFAVPVIVALVHDIFITVGIYALTGREVTAATVAAVLTVLGYSMYDTIIIFDRVRENLPLMRRSAFATIANVSIWETLVRSLATTFITLLPVASLLILGGATLKDFAFALLIGIGSGAYSTIFIATPLLTILKEREPEFARRIGEGHIDKSVASGVLHDAEAAAAAAPTPTLLPEPVAAPAADGDGDGDGAAARAAGDRHERRRQRRSTRPHGRAR